MLDVVATLETAHFRVDDADSLVAASLACSGCLSSAVDWRLSSRRREDPSVACHCRSCGRDRRLWVTPDQALRLSMHAVRRLDPTADAEPAGSRPFGP
jgi:hypothetical protein